MNSHFQSRKIRFFIRGLIIFFLILIVLFGFAYFLLLKNPENLLSGPLQKLEKETGCEIKIGSISVNLLPLPAISISDFAIKNDKFDFSTAWGSIRPDFLLLCTGQFTPTQISLLRPKLSLKSDLDLSDPQLVAEQFKKFEAQGALQEENEIQAWLGNGCGLDLQKAQFQISGANNTSFTISDADCQLDASLSTVEGRIKIPALLMKQSDNLLLWLDEIFLQGNVNFQDLFAANNYFRTSGKINFHNILQNGVFQIDYGSSDNGWLMNFSTHGDLRLGASSQPFKVSGKAISYLPQKEITVRELNWSLGNDNGEASAIITLPDKEQGFKIDGYFLAERLSLTQWFGFARNLAPGLQLSLDNVLNTKLVFQLDASGLKVSKIDATCSGAHFSGTGGVPSFAKPVVVLDLKSKEANLGLSLGEALGRSPLAPKFDHPPLTPMPGEPLKPGETGIGYDIRLAAKTLVYGPLKIKNSSLRIYPGKIDKNGLEEVLLDANADFYGGKFKGNCVLGAPASLPIAITANCSNISAQAVYKDLPVMLVNKGKIRLAANITSEGKELKPFLNNLKGLVSISATDVGVAQNKSLQFPSLSASANLRSSAMSGKKIWFDGAWQLAAAMENMSAQANLNGKVWFDLLGAEIKSLPASFKLNLNGNNDLLPAGLQLLIKGTSNFQSSTAKFALAQAQLELAGTTVNGNFSLDGSKGAYNGDFQFNQPDLQNFLAKLGFTGIKLPKAFNTLKIISNFSGSNEQIKLSKINSHLGAISINGDLNCAFSDGPALKFNLEANKINLEKLTPATNSKTTQPTSLDFPIMRKLSASGELKIAELSGWKMRLLNARIPLQIKNGFLVANSITANLYGAVLNCGANIDFKKGISFTNRLSARAMDLKTATAPFINSGVLSGLATVEINDNAKLTNSSQFPAALNGKWNLEINNGSWQGKNKKGQLGKPTVLGKIRASGNIENGVLNTSNISIQGPELTVKGNGRLNLDTKKVDCKLDISMKGIPDFPLTVYGTIDKPKTSIGAGKLVLNALGEIAGGVGDIIGGIAEGIWKIFK